MCIQFHDMPQLTAHPVCVYYMITVVTIVLTVKTYGIISLLESLSYKLAMDH